MIEAILWILFILACIVVSGVILLQEGKGGGLGEAFGGAGQQTFGVKAEGINKFTGWATLGVVVLAIVITKVREDSSSIVFNAPAPPMQGVPAEPGAAPGLPAGEQPVDEVPAGDQPPAAPPADETPPPASDEGGDK